MSTRLPCVEIEPPHAADSAIIWLHGLGANGHDFEPIVPELGLSPSSNTRFIFPHAPQRPVTINNGFVMPAWFDILTLERRNPIDEAGILESVTALHTLIQREETRGICSERIVLAGFSQGGVIATQAALRYEKPLGGLMSLSSYLPLTESLSLVHNPANLTLPIFMAHGHHDPVLPYTLGYEAYLFLQSSGYQVEWHEYSMQHQVCGEEIEDISEWLLNLQALKPVTP